MGFADNIGQFLNANPLAMLLLIVLVLAQPAGIVALWLQGRNQRIASQAKQRELEVAQKQAEKDANAKRLELEEQIRKTKADLEMKREEGEQEAQRRLSDLLKEQLTVNRSLAAEITENRKEREASHRTLEGFLADHLKATAALEGQSLALTRIEQTIAAEFDDLHTAHGGEFEAIRAEQLKHAAEIAGARLDIRQAGDAIQVRLTELDPTGSLSTISDALLQRLQELKMAQEAAQTDILNELRQVSAQVLPINEHLKNEQSKWDRLNALVAQVQQMAERIAEMAQSPAEVTTVVENVAPSADDDDDTVELEIKSPGTGTGSGGC